jgi:repressor LexA
MQQEAIAARLKQARIDAGIDSVKDAASRLGVPYPTYAAHENGSRAFDASTAAFYARRYKVTLDWLVAGRHAGSTYTEVAVMGYVGAGAEVNPDFEQVPPDGLETVDLPFAIDDDLIAFKVRGDSMLPYYKENAIIVVYREQRKPLDAFYGEEAAVRTEDGRRFIKTIMRGERGVNLISWNAAPIENVKLVWIGEIFANLPGTSVRPPRPKSPRH